MAIFLLCLKIFFVRILDVSLGTFRTMVMVKGKRFYAAVIGFFEILIWFLIVREALNTDITSIWVAISYAGGFATGTYVGMVISDKYISEILEIQIITENYKELVSELRKNNFAVTATKVLGIDDQSEKYMLFISINSENYQKLNKILKGIDRKAFMVINESKYVRNGYFIDKSKK